MRGTIMTLSTSHSKQSVVSGRSAGCLIGGHMSKDSETGGGSKAERTWRQRFQVALSRDAILWQMTARRQKSRNRE